MNIIYDPFAISQVWLDAAQVGEFGAFLGESKPPAACEPEIELQDSEHDHGRIHAAWNGQGNRLTITLSPTTPWESAPPEMTLTVDQVEKLAGFLNAWSPGA